ncbi:CPBP family intramembrane metalloprotease [bacterium]|nr:CPBP family intramembrane metalloprotease [bacterium]
MMETRLTKKDLMLLLICLVVVVIAGYFEVTNYHRAFPEHSIDFQVNRKESRDIALQFLKTMDVNPGAKTHAVAFDFDNTAKIFIEKEIGIEDSEELLTNEFRIWQWTNRWFQPLSREEIIVSVTPKGEITRFEHKIPEESAAPLLSIDDARRLGHRFLKNIININMNDWEFIEHKTEVRPNRVDYQFTYKKKNVEIYDATYRFELIVQGDKIGRYKEYLHIPEEWKRNYQQLRSLNATTATTADVLFLLLLIAVFVTFIIYLAKKQVNTKTALAFGIITFILKFLSELNLLPLYKFHFDTNQSLGAFYSGFFIEVFIQSLLLALLITVITGAGEYMYRDRFPNRIPLGKLFSLRGLKSKHFFFSVIIGITLAISFMAFQTIFYLVAKHYGAWAPADISYSEILNTAFPWILILIGGFLPAVLEEFTFRFFSIPFLEKLLKSKLLAILIPAAIWGFAHANYPNQPFWIRGFEVSIFGILIGFIFLKFGILTVLIWHYTVDAIYSSIILFQTGETYHIISSSVTVGIMLIPLLYNIIMYIKHRGFSEHEPLLERGVPDQKPLYHDKQPSEACQPLKDAYRQLTPKRIKIGLALLIVFLLIKFIPIQPIGEFYNYPVPRSEIKQTATEFLKGKGVDPDNFRNTLILENNYNQLTGQYILEHSSVKKLNSILARYLNNPVVWKMRFYRPLEKEEYIIYIHPGEKKVVGFDHLLPEDAAAFSLDKDGARFRSEKFLLGCGYQLTDFTLVEDYSRQLQNRKEYTFIWESEENHPANVEQATLRLNTIISGDDVSAYSIFYKIPEEWRHRKTQKTLFYSIRLGIQIISLCLIAVISIIILTRRIKSISIQWKAPLITGSVIGGLWLITELLNYPFALTNYNSSWTIGVWTVFWTLISLLKFLAITGMIFLLLAIISALYPAGLTTLRRDCRYHFSRDAVFGAILVTVGLAGVQHLISWGALRFAPTIIHPDFQINGAINYFFPLARSVIGIISRGIIYTAVIGILIFWIKETISIKILRPIIAALLLAVFIPDTFHTATEFLVLYASYGIAIIWIWIAARFFLRNNIPAYLYAGITYAAVTTSVKFVQSGTPNGYVNALFILFIVTISLIWSLTEKRSMNIAEWIKKFTKQVLVNK